MRALVYGAMNPDLVHFVDRLPERGDDIRSTSWELTWGGKAANAAMALAEWGVDTHLLGLVIGEDALGDALLAALQHPHLDASWIERNPAESTRHCLILLTPDGDRTIVCAGYDDARWQDVPDAAWADTDVVLIDGFGGAAAERVAVLAADRGIPTVWPDAPDPPPLTPAMIVWSRHEHAEDAAAAAAAAGHDIALTAGEDPIAVWWRGERFDVTPPRIGRADSTGAGDTFAAACALGLASGATGRRLVEWAAAAGAASVASGRRSLPTRAAIDALARRTYPDPA